MACGPRRSSGWAAIRASFVARRLSNAEYDYTIRDLTGQDLHVARQFPVRSANTAGFDNSVKPSTMSPALLNKYLQGARQIADHMVLKPDGLDFAPYSMQVETTGRNTPSSASWPSNAAQPTDYANYFEAAWRYRYRKALGIPMRRFASVRRRYEGERQISAAGLGHSARQGCRGTHRQA